MCELEEKSERYLSPPGRYLKITVADRGCGIEDDLVTKIFDPYFTTKPNGSGLGLAIGYSVVKKHGGMLHLESSSPEGSTFAFYLPATDGRGGRFRRAERGMSVPFQSPAHSGDG